MDTCVAKVRSIFHSVPCSIPLPRRAWNMDTTRALPEAAIGGSKRRSRATLHYDTLFCIALQRRSAA
jgi:hypothetical protein